MQSRPLYETGAPKVDSSTKIAEILVNDLLSLCDDKQLRSLAHFISTRDSNALSIHEEAFKYLIDQGEDGESCIIRPEYLPFVIKGLEER